MECQFEKCEGEAQFTIEDSETLREVEICEQCMNWINSRRNGEMIENG